jgi:hypothetical protein
MTRGERPLDQETLHEVHRVIVEEGFDRDVLLARLPPSLVSSLRTAPTPAQQILQDLEELNRMDGLPNGVSPIGVVLETAVHLSSLKSATHSVGTLKSALVGVGVDRETRPGLSTALQAAGVAAALAAAVAYGLLASADSEAANKGTQAPREGPDSSPIVNATVLPSATASAQETRAAAPVAPPTAKPSSSPTRRPTSAPSSGGARPEVAALTVVTVTYFEGSNVIVYGRQSDGQSLIRRQFFSSARRPGNYPSASFALPGGSYSISCTLGGENVTRKVEIPQGGRSHESVSCIGP